MPEYVVLSKLTDEGRKTLKKKPERIMEVNKELEDMGVKVKIVEAPDNEAMMKMSVELGARGSIELLTLPALDIEAFVKQAT